jgi:HsdM N-terminal domain
VTAPNPSGPPEVRSEDPVPYTVTRRRRGLPKNSVLGNKPMEQMLWDAACAIRGEKDESKFKDYLRPLLFAKHLSDVFDDEVRRSSPPQSLPSLPPRVILWERQLF